MPEPIKPDSDKLSCGRSCSCSCSSQPPSLNAGKAFPDILFILGWVMGVGFLLDLAANLGDPYEILWFCSASALLLTVGLFRKNSLIITVVFLLAIPAQFFWIVDFILSLFGKGMGRTAMLSFAGPLVYWTSLLLHVLLIPVATYGVWKLGFNKKALFPAMVYFWALLTATFYLTQPELNHNCVFYPCDMPDPGGAYGMYFLYTLVSWTVVLIIQFLLMRFLWSGRTLQIEKNKAQNG